MRLAAAFLVVLGYVVAVPIMFRLRMVFADRRVRWFLAFETAVAAVALGHLLSGRPVAGAVNAAAALVLAGAWWHLGRRRPRPSRPA